MNPAGGTPANLAPDLPPDGFANDPALAPDGRTLAYTLIVVPPVGGATTSSLPGTDLWVMDATGGGARLLLKHDLPGAQITRPAWTPDGKALVYAYAAPILGPDGRYTGTIRQLQRLDVESGERTVLVEGGEAPAFSPVAAAAPFAYVQTDPRTFDQELWVAGLDGRDGRRLLATGKEFVAVGAPQFSPDGKRLVFAASPAQAVGPPGGKGGGLPGRVARWFAAPFNPPAAGAHGPPWDLWTVALDGGDLRRLTEVYEDQPSPAWSPDGAQVAFLAGGGIYVTGADGRGLTKVSAKGGHGPIVWAPTAPTAGGAP